MLTKNLKKETDALHQIARASEAIRQKYRLIKFGKESVQKAMNEVLEPVVTPLEKLVTQSDSEKKEKKESNRKKKPQGALRPYRDNFETALESGSDDEYMALPSLDESQMEKTLPHFSPKSSSPIAKTSSKNTQKLLDQYLQQLTTKSNDLDLKYGVRKLKSGMYIGDTPVFFENNVMRLKDQQYTLTPGLMELIFQKSPDMELVTETDKQNYGTILATTNAARKYYDANSALRSDFNLPKYTKVIENILGVEEGEEKFKKNTGGGLPDYLIASRERPPTDYIYWDDPNELVDRLRLLVASQSAGNFNHTNEIVSIIEELREARIIY